MISITALGAPAFLIPYQPNWSADVVGNFDKLTFRDAGATNREEREPLAQTLRATLSYSVQLNAAEATALRAALGAWDNRPILCPFWPAETKLANVASASVQGALRIWYEPDWSHYFIGTTGDELTGFEPSAECLTAPLLWGRFDSFPKMTPMNGLGDEAGEFHFIENGAPAYALKPKDITLTLGAQVNDVDVPKLTVPCHWGSNTETIDVRIKRDKVGYGREDADTFFPQKVRGRHTLSFAAMDGADIANMLALFDDRGGSVAPWWIAAPHSTSALIYGRFYGDRLSILWAKPARAGELAACEIEFIELPTEQTVPSGETFGETIGPKPGPWFGYKITDGVTTWRVTSYESSVDGPGGTYTHQGISHGRITKEINMKVSDCTLTVQHWAGGPFARLIQSADAANLTVTIYEGTIDAPEDAEAIYTGTAMAPDTASPQMKIKLRGPSALLTVEGPRMILQKTCAAVFGDSRCKIDLATKRVTKTCLSITNGVAEFDALASGFSAHYFQYGVARRVRGGATYDYMVGDSYALENGNLALSLIGSIAALEDGEADWILTPGCDLSAATCKNRWNNRINFRGARDMPNDNPSMLALPQAPGTSKK